MYEDSTKSARSSPQGLGGWLIVFLLALWGDAASRLAAGISTWTGILHLVRNPEIQMRPLPATIAVIAGLLGAIAGFLMATKHRRGPALAKGLLSLEAGYYLLSLLSVLFHTGPVVSDTLPLWVKPGGYFFAFFVGLAYLLRSRRVANTWAPAPEQANPSEMFQNDESSAALRTRIFPWEEVNNAPAPSDPPAEEFNDQPVDIEETGQSEFDALKAQITDGVIEWLASTVHNPNSHPSAHAALIAEAGDGSIEDVTLKLLDQVTAICDHVWSVHTGQSPTLPNTADSGGSLAKELQKWAVAQAAFRLTRSLDIRAALEANGPFEKLARDHDYLMAIVQKNSSEDAFGRKVDLAEYEGHTGPEIAYKLILKAQRDMFEGDMWAEVASLAGDPDFLARFSTAGAKTFQDSLDYWHERGDRAREYHSPLTTVGAALR